MDMLYYNAAGVERNVFFHTVDLLNLKVDLIFYDTTTASESLSDTLKILAFPSFQMRYEIKSI